MSCIVGKADEVSITCWNYWNFTFCSAFSSYPGNSATSLVSNVFSMALVYNLNLNVQKTHVHKRDGSSVRPKSSMLEKAIRELEKMVAECKIIDYFDISTLI